MAADMPELQGFFSTGSLIDAVLNMGSSVPIDVRVTGSDLNADYGLAQGIAQRIRSVKGVADVYIPQDIDYPSLQQTVDRTRVNRVGSSHLF